MMERCTIVVDVRDRFSCLAECLDRLIEETPEPHDLIVVAGGEVAPVRWTVNGFRDGHCATPEGDREIAPPWSIVAPEGTGRSPIPEVLSYIMGDR
jgi:hypothetical protein